MAYRIRPGDTLSQLAVRYRTTVSALMKANPYIRNADLIFAGRTLRIPGSSDSYSAKSTRKSSSNVVTSFISKVAGKLSSRAQHLAEVARNMAAKMNTRGWCARGVMNSLEAAGMAVPRVPSAWMAASRLAADPRFREVRLTDAQIQKLPPGAIIVSAAYNSPGNPHGHIAVTLGNGMEASDHIARIRTHGTQRVFIPV